MVLFALLQAAASVPAPPPRPAPWSVVTRANPDGSLLSAAAAVISDDGKARLVVRCDRAAVPVVSLQFRVAGGGLSADKEHSVIVAVDGAAPIDAAWEFPGLAAVLSEPNSVTDLTVALASAKSFTVSTSNAGAPVVATFVGPGAVPAVRQVLDACGYTLGTVPEPVNPAAK